MVQVFALLGSAFILSHFYLVTLGLRELINPEVSST